MDDGFLKIRDLLERVVYGNCGDVDTANQLVSAILEWCPTADDDERFAELMYILASYDPNGGPYLYDQLALTNECRHVLSLLD